MIHCPGCNSVKVEQTPFSNLGLQTVVGSVLWDHRHSLTYFRCLQPDCSKSWYGCDRSCLQMSTVANTNSCSTAYWNTQSLRRHLRLSHRITSTQVEVEDDPLLEGLENASEDPDDAMDSFNWDDGTEMEDPPIVGSPAYFFQSNTMQDHLNNVRETSFFGAVTRLVCRSAHGGKERTKDEVPSQWIKLYLHVAHLVLMLGDDGRELLSEILIFSNVSVPPHSAGFFLCRTCPFQPPHRIFSQWY
jgi:hypothetical protein